MPERIKQILKLGYERIMDPFYLGFAAQIAFYLLLSIVPTIIVLSQILGLFGLSLESLSGAFENDPALNVYIPQFLPDLLSYTSSSALNIFFSVTALWAASRAQFSIARIANYTMTAGADTGNYFKERIRAVKTILITLFTLVFSLLIFVYGGAVLEFVLNNILPLDFVKPLVMRLWSLLRWPLAFVLYFVMVGTNYYFLPMVRVPFKQLLPGTVFASLGMLVATVVYMYAQSHFMRYDLLYGSLSSVAALLIWFYILAWVLVLGILLNKARTDSAGFANSAGSAVMPDKSRSEP